MLKADGSVLVHADAGGYKPLHWMTPPTVIEEAPDKIEVRRPKGDERLLITIIEILSKIELDVALEAALQKDGVEVDLAELRGEREPELTLFGG